jgi:hypothetical protein
MKKMILIVSLCFFSYSIFAQAQYKQAIGIKLPGGFSATYKNFITPKNAIELQATFWSKGVRFAGLYEFNFEIEGAQGLNWYVGPGVHLGVWNTENKKAYNASADLGIDGIIGLDYKFKNAPINISIDWQPSISVLGNTGVSPALGGLGLRYTF